jgi:hypothetical protein
MNRSPLQLLLSEAERTVNHDTDVADVDALRKRATAQWRTAALHALRQAEKVMAFRGISWHFVAFRGISWHFVGFRGISWDFVALVALRWSLLRASSAAPGAFAPWLVRFDG